MTFHLIPLASPNRKRSDPTSHAVQVWTSVLMKEATRRVAVLRSLLIALTIRQL
jgi:hypothetical protein